LRVRRVSESGSVDDVRISGLRRPNKLMSLGGDSPSPTKKQPESSAALWMER